jgi:hypothetical protein
MPIALCPKKSRMKGVGNATIYREELVEKLEQKPKDYYKVAQLLEWEDDGWAIRLGYYLKPHGTRDNEWQWGSQTTSIINIEYIDNLIEALVRLKKTYEDMQKER